MKKSLPLILLATVALLTMDVLCEDSILFPKVENNVAYSSVTQLAVKPADSRFTYGEDQFQHGLIWLPNGATKKSSEIILIHGGCWLNAFDVKHTYALSTALSQHGYKVYSLEYRRTGDQGGGWPGSFNDIKAGIKKVFSIQASEKINTIVVGHSAGGHLALLAGSESAFNKSTKELSGVIGLAAITDIEAYAAGKNSCQTATPMFMGGTFLERKSDYDDANPINQTLHENTVLLQGTSDSIVPKLQANVKGVSTKFVEGAGHFDWIHPGSEAFTLLLETLKQMENN